MACRVLSIDSPVHNSKTIRWSNNKLACIASSVSEGMASLLLFVSLPSLVHALNCVQCDSKERNASMAELCLLGFTTPIPCPPQFNMCITDYYRSSDPQGSEPIDKVMWRKCGSVEQIGCKVFQTQSSNPKQDAFIVSPNNPVQLRPGELQVCSVGCSDDGCVLKGGSTVRRWSWTLPIWTVLCMCLSL